MNLISFFFKCIRRIIFILVNLHRFFTNRIVAYIPCNFFRKGWYRLSEDFCAKGGSIEIGDYAFIGVNVTVLHSVKIGKGAVVCAGAVVTKDVPDFAVVAGIPAKVIGTRN